MGWDFRRAVLAVVTLSPLAGIAADCLRTVIFAAVQSDQNASAKTPENLHRLIFPKQTNGFAEQRKQQRRQGRIEHIADVIVSGDFVDLEQALAVRLATPRFQQALVGEKRRALHEKYRKRSQADIAHAIADIVARALVGKLFADAAKRAYERFDNHMGQ
jgi:hypothetical protein